MVLWGKNECGVNEWILDEMVVRKERAWGRGGRAFISFRSLEGVVMLRRWDLC